MRALVKKLDEVHEHPAYRSVWTISHIHVGPYTGPTYEMELKQARAALSRPTHSQPVNAGEVFEEIRECSRNLWRSNALREREHYHLISLVDKAEKATLLREAPGAEAVAARNEAIESAKIEAAYASTGDSWENDFCKNLERHGFVILYGAALHAPPVPAPGVTMEMAVAYRAAITKHPPQFCMHLDTIQDGLRAALSAALQPKAE